jgi:sensor histidine kinase YesM
MKSQAWWKNYNERCTEGVLDENSKSEIIRMNNNFLFTILAVVPFIFIDIYYGLIPLLLNKSVTILCNLVFIFLSSTKRFKFLSHYLMSALLMGTLFHAVNYVGPESHLYLFYFSSLIEFAILFLNKKLVVILLNVGATIIFLSISFYYNHSLFLNKELSTTYLSILKWTAFITFFYSIIFHVFNSIAVRKRYERLLEFEKNAILENEKKLTQEKILLEMRNQDAEYRILKNQLNPHFIFNTLDTIRYLYKHDVQKTDVFINHLSSFLRVSLKNDHSIVTVLDELMMLDDYLNLQLIRFSGTIQFESNISEFVKPYFIPYFSLVTLVENAIKHNHCTIKYPLSIHLYNDEEYLYISNRIRKKNITQSSTGIGLKNLSERYKFLYNIDLSVQEDSDNFTVKLKLIKS